MSGHQGRRYIYRYRDKLWTIKSLAEFLMVNESTLATRLGKTNTINNEPVRCVGVGTYAMCFEVFDRFTGKLLIRGKDSECADAVYTSIPNLRAAAKYGRLIADQYKVKCVGHKHFVNDKEIDYQ